MVPLIVGTRFSLALLLVTVHNGIYVDAASLEMSEAFPNNEIGLGEKRRVNCTAYFPPGTTHDVLLEIVTSINGTNLVVGQISDVFTSGISAVENNPLDTAPITYTDEDYTTDCYDQTGKVQYVTRFKHDMGTVESSSIDGYIKIGYEVVLACMTDHPDGYEIWNTCAMTYRNTSDPDNFEEYMFVAQNNLYLYSTPVAVATNMFLDILPDPYPELRYGIEQGDELTLTLSVYIPFPITALHVTAIILTNTSHLDLSKMSVAKVGTAYTYSVVTPIEVVGYDSCPMTSQLHIGFDRLINKESQETYVDTRLNELQFDLQLVSLGGTIGEVYNIGFAVETGATMDTISRIDVSDPVEVVVLPGQYSPSVSTTLTTTDSTISPNFVGTATLELSILMRSSLSYIVSIATHPLDGAIAAMEITGVRPISYGSNIHCPIPDEIQAVISETKESATYSFAVSNNGRLATAADNKLELNVMIQMSNTAVENEVYELDVTTSAVGGTSDGHKYLAFTVTPAETFDGPVSFTFYVTYSHTSIRFTTGGTVAIDLEVITAPDTTTGPLILEFPLPSDLETTPLLTLCTASIVNVGANVVSVSSGPLTSTTVVCCTNVTAVNQTFWSRIEIPVVSNVQLDPDPVANSFHVQTVFNIEDVPSAFGSGITFEFGIKIQYSSTQIFTEKKEVRIDDNEQFTRTQIITGIILPNSVIDPNWYDVFVFQFSLDGVHFYDYTSSFSTIRGKSFTTLIPHAPLLTRYPRVTTKRCTAIKDRLLSNFDTLPVNTSISIFGEQGSPKQDKLTNSLMLSLDKDRTTCFDLPQPSDATMPPVLYMNIATSFLGLPAVPYNVKVVGKGLSCDDHGIQKVTQVKFPRQAMSGLFGGTAELCRIMSGSGPAGEHIVCHYQCNCSDITSCSNLLVFIAATQDLGGSRFQLCELETYTI